MLLVLPADMVALLAPFAPLFSRPVWRHVQTLLVGAILSPGQRTAGRRRRRKKPRTPGAGQLFRQEHRGRRDRSLVGGGDPPYAAWGLLEGVRWGAPVPPRLRLDARLFAPPPPRLPHQKGRPR